MSYLESENEMKMKTENR